MTLSLSLSLLQFPDALRPAFPRLKKCLEDPDPGVQCAAVSVICELAQKNPKNYLSLAPTLFKLMNSSTNNWMLIKIIKLVSVHLLYQQLPRSLLYDLHVHIHVALIVFFLCIIYISHEVSLRLFFETIMCPACIC